MPADLRSLMRIEVPLIARLARREMPLRDVLGWAPGMIVELGKPSRDDLDILVNNKPIGRGRAVKIGENYGIRVTGVGDARARLAGMRRDRQDAAASPTAPTPEPPVAAASSSVPPSA